MAIQIRPRARPKAKLGPNVSDDTLIGLTIAPNVIL